MESALYIQATTMAALCGALLSAGCAGNDAIQKELQALRTEVTSLRASNAALGERLDAIEIQRGSFKPSGPPPPDAQGTGPDPGAPPDLQVVRLKPTGEDSYGGEDGARVKIKSTPGGLVQEEVKGDDKDDPKTTPKTTPKKDPPKKDPPKPAPPKKGASPPETPPAGSAKP